MPTKKVFIYIVVALVVLALVFVGISLFGKKVTPADFAKSMEPRPAPAVPHGKQIYEVVQSEIVSPYVRFVVLDPVDAKAGETQKITVVMDSDPVASSTEVKVEVPGETAISSPQTITLTKQSSVTLSATREYYVGEDNNLADYTGQVFDRSSIPKVYATPTESSVMKTLNATVVRQYNLDLKSFVTSTIGEIRKMAAAAAALRNVTSTATAPTISAPNRYEFTGEWKVNKQYESAPRLSVLGIENIDQSAGIKASSRNPKINLKLIAKTAKRESRIPFFWDKTCAIPLGGNWEAVAGENCVVSSPDGLDAGNLLVQKESAVIIDGDFAVNPDKAIVFAVGGQLIVNSANSIKHSYLWRSPDDKNGAKEVISDGSPGVNFVRRLTLEPTESAPLKGFNENGQIYTVAQGEQKFSVSQNVKTGPKIIQVDINPLDVKPGDVQTMTIVTESLKPIQSVIAKVETDKRIVEVPLFLEGKAAAADLLPKQLEISGNQLVVLDKPIPYADVAENPLVNVSHAQTPEHLTYSGSWTVHDTISKKYRTAFYVKDADGVENSITMAWSDPCISPNHYGNLTISFDCSSYSGIDGTINGNITVSGNMNYNSSAMLVFAPNYHITISAGKSIAINANAVAAGGGIKKGYISGTDGDNDGYSSNIAPLSFSTSATNNILTKPYTDCDDGDAGVHPGITAYFYSQSVHGLWDYDCSGAAENNLNIPITLASLWCWTGCAVYDGYRGYVCDGGYDGYDGDPGCGGGAYFTQGCVNPGGPGVGCDPFVACYEYQAGDAYAGYTEGCH